MEILSSLKEVYEIKAFWEKSFLEDYSATIFQTWGWNYNWIHEFLAKKTIYIMIDRNLSSIAPLYLRNWGNLKILDFIGTRGSDYLDIISSSKYTEFLNKVFHHFAKSDFDVLNMEDFRENFKKEKIIKEVVISNGLYMNNLNWCPSYSVDLNNNYKDIISKKVLRGYQARKRKLEKDYGKFLIVDGTKKDLDKHYELHQKRFENSWSRGSYFSAKNKLFMNNFFTYLQEKDLAHFKILFLNGNHVASILGGKLNKRIFIYTTALDSGFNEYGLGKMLFIEDILRSQSESNKYYDLMRGSEDYKKEIGCRESMNKKIVITKRKEDYTKYMARYKFISRDYNYAPSTF